MTRKDKLFQWIDSRLPVFTFFRDHLRDYQTPKNLNYFWNFGSILGVLLLVMIVTGLVLAMQYTPHVDMAFDSVERIMRDVNYGWLLRYIHSNGSSFFFIAIYIHTFRGMYYGSYKSPREILWILGVLTLVLLMVTAFVGYTLPWGQMSFWGATVITNLFSAIPFIGDEIVTFIWGGYAVGNPTLNRFYVLHFLIPFIILAVVFVHLIALHKAKSNNPLGVDSNKAKDNLPFHPYYTVKDYFGFGVFFLVFFIFVFFLPNFFGEPDNYIPANPLVTPGHIVPEWYFLPFYAILRSVPDKLIGVILMFGAVFILFLLPWLDRHPVKSATFRPIYKQFFWLFVLDCFILGWIGSNPPVGHYIYIGRVATIFYFSFFIVILPLLTKFEKIQLSPAKGRKVNQQS
jgi:ubiquinol-cytochrome c reductase cytochrome b subunit|tara:strand:- start:1025 stop:2227 length:1203 start_codon:yes stop_codon:yes gene_type:complete